MNSFLDLVQAIPPKRREGWEPTHDAVRVSMRGGQRHQTVHVDVVDGTYVLSSVVLGTRVVTKSQKRWRRLALLAWQRNAEHQVITFCFDQRHRLVGRVEHPAEHLDPAELELYVNVLARECDRFEYLLSGRDEF